MTIFSVFCRKSQLDKKILVQKARLLNKYANFKLCRCFIRYAHFLGAIFFGTFGILTNRVKALAWHGVINSDLIGHLNKIPKIAPIRAIWHQKKQKSIGCKYSDEVIALESAYTLEMIGWSLISWWRIIVESYIHWVTKKHIYLTPYVCNEQLFDGLQSALN